MPEPSDVSFLQRRFRDERFGLIYSISVTVKCSMEVLETALQRTSLGTAGRAGSGAMLCAGPCPASPSPPRLAGCSAPLSPCHMGVFPPKHRGGSCRRCRQRETSLPPSCLSFPWEAAPRIGHFKFSPNRRSFPSCPSPPGASVTLRTQQKYLLVLSPVNP